MPRDTPASTSDAPAAATSDAPATALPLVAEPIGLLAARLLAAVPADGVHLHVAGNETRADAIVAALRALAPDEAEILAFPPWDCLPYDRASPSAGVMGRRLASLRGVAAAAAEGRRCILVATPSALAQRVPSVRAVAGAALRLRAGEPLDPSLLHAWLDRAGYREDARVDEPGEAVVRAGVVDVFPAGNTAPLRLTLEEGRLAALSLYDPLTQRSLEPCDAATLDPASEAALDSARDVLADDGSGAPTARADAAGEDGSAEDNAGELPGGIEHWLPESLRDALVAMPEHLPADATVSLDPAVEARRTAFLERVRDAHQSRRTLLRQGLAIAPIAVADDDAEEEAPPEAAPRAPLPPEALYLTATPTDAVLADRRLVPVGELGAGGGTVPRFATADGPDAAFADYLKHARDAGWRIVLAATAPRDLAALSRRAVRALRPAGGAAPAAEWAACLDAAPGAVLTLRAALPAGFEDAERGIAVITAQDVLGRRAAAIEAAEPAGNAATLLAAELDTPQPGDAVIHLDHGMASLRGLEAIPGAVGEGDERDALRLEFADGAGLLVPAEAIDRIWRYGADASAVALDRLDSEVWPRRRAEIEAAVGEAAVGLAALAAERAALRAPKLAPPAAALERFADGFAFAETADQASAIAAVLADLESGRPMDRLVVGDVGYGKTEVALRAAAAAALAGKQVAVAAPTTVLARQHFAQFARRFAGTGLAVAHLSRLVPAAEQKATRAAIKAGEVRVVVGTHALAGKDVTFAELGLLIVDEEQRFGAAQKAKLRALGGPATHLLTMTATPIPRTLQTALAGLRDLSIIATPPVRRQPIATALVPFDDATVRAALMREKSRGGQSFVVCPRVEDIAPMAKRLRRAVRELRVLVAHGGLPPAEMDDTMVRFADGEGDVLLATNIIESGLDVPRANTMLVWRADRFGLAQLHQLRGRVGRGGRRGTCYLLTDPEQTLARATERRLRTLESLDRLGAGFAIAARDLDQRGGGELLGDAQAGHLKLIGAGLYRHLLEGALRTAQGKPAEPDWTPDLRLGLAARIPDDYVPEAELRLALHARLAASRRAAELTALADEIEDRFGTPPDAVTTLLGEARLRLRCRRLGVARIDAGPQAIAVTFRDGAAPATPPAVNGVAMVAKGERLVLTTDTATGMERVSLVGEVLDALAGAAGGAA